MIDLLKQIELGTLTITEGEALIDKTIADYHNKKIETEWWQHLGFNKYEATAYAHGGSLADLYVLRTRGWPEICPKCGQSLEYRRFGWMLVHVDDGPPVIHHLECPGDKRKDQGINTSGNRPGK